MRHTNEKVTLIQCCFNAGPASQVSIGRPRDNALPVCTFKQQSQKAVFTSEQILPLQADNVLQPVAWWRLSGRDIPTMPHLAVSPAIM